MYSSHERPPWLPLYSMSPYFSPLANVSIETNAKTMIIDLLCHVTLPSFSQNSLNQNRKSDTKL